MTLAEEWSASLSTVDVGSEGNDEESCVDKIDQRHANQERFTGALLGMAIGDAMGMPVAGWSRERIRDTYQRIESYFPKFFEDGAELQAGEFTDESELALCIVESYTASQSVLDPDVILARMRFLAAGESRRWMHPATLAALAEDEANADQGEAPPESRGPDVVSRGIPVGLIHAIGPLSLERLREDARLVTELTHDDSDSVDAVTLVATAVAIAARRSTTLKELPQAILAMNPDLPPLLLNETIERMTTESGGLVSGDLAQPTSTMDAALEGVAIACLSARFEDAVFDAVNAGGLTDTRGAVAGAIAGAWHGSSGIPQRLVDELEGRIYLSVAVPWFYRAVQRGSGRSVSITPVQSDPGSQSSNGASSKTP